MNLYKRLKSTTQLFIIASIGLLYGCQSPTNYEFSNSLDSKRNSEGYLFPPPENFQITLSSDQQKVQLNWEDITESETGFTLEKKVGASAFFELARLDANTIYYEDDLGEKGTKPIQYRIRSIFDSEYSDYVNTEVILFYYDLDVQLIGQGRVEEQIVQTKAKEYEYETVIELEATPSEGWRFIEWTGDITGIENPVQVTITDTTNITAVFEVIAYPLTINVQGEGLVDEELIQQKTVDYDYGSLIQLTATPSEGWEFIRWEGDLSGTETPTTITVRDSTVVSAVFEKQFHPIIVDVQGEGEVTLNPEQVDYEYGTEVELLATPSEGWRFIEWTGDITGIENPVQVTITDTTNITAVFEVIAYPLTINVQGEGFVDEELIQQKTVDYDYGSLIQLTATPSEGWEFIRWEGDLSGTETPTTITVRDSTVVSAVFEKQFHPIIVDVQGEGEVTLNPEQVDYEYGTEVELLATPSEGWRFIEWTGDITGIENPVQVTITDTTNITAVFEEVPDFYLAENGVTVVCDFAELGDTATINGIVYTKRNEFQITTINAATSCTSGISNMRFLFHNDSNFNSDLSSWDVSDVIDMRSMFENAAFFNQNLNFWDVSNVTDMSFMFKSARRFNMDLSNWDVGNVTDMSYMFSDADEFNRDISSWDVSSVINMNSMFRIGSCCNNNFNQDLSSWNVSNVTDMSYMFYNAHSFLADLKEWNVSNVTDMSYMFYNARLFYSNIGAWDVSNVIDMSYMFYNARQFNTNIGAWDVSSATDMNYMFYYATIFDQDLTGWCVTNITSLPTEFASGSPLYNSEKIPSWGSCPGQ